MKMTSEKRSKVKLGSTFVTDIRININLIYLKQPLIN